MSQQILQLSVALHGIAYQYPICIRLSSIYTYMRVLLICITTSLNILQCHASNRGHPDKVSDKFRTS